MIKWPGMTKPGAVTDALFAQIDLMATFSNYLGFELPKNSAEDSHDFLPYLKGETKTPPRTTMVHNTSKEYAIRNGDWVLIDAKTGAARQPSDAWLKNTKFQHTADSPWVSTTSAKTLVSETTLRKSSRKRSKSYKPCLIKSVIRDIPRRVLQSKWAMTRPIQGD